MVSVESFFELLINELKLNAHLKGYYKFLGTKSSSTFEFRKRYFCQRLEFIQKNVGPRPSQVWDCGTGYGTTAIFLALNGHHVYGNTLEFYYAHVSERLDYWNKFGDLSRLEISYSNLFDLDFRDRFDFVVLQDTLHHLEPINDAIRIIHNSLRTRGKIIVVEENGNNIFINSKNYVKRGNKRVIEIYDENLERSILIGNENTRSLALWKDLFSQHDLFMKNDSVEFVRILLPPFYKVMGPAPLSNLETKLSNNNLLRNYFFFGLNFLVEKRVD